MSLISLFFYKIREWEGGTGPAWECRWHHWKADGGKERSRRVNIVQKMCTHVCKSKNDTC
jgi:hypothetical protein